VIGVAGEALVDLLVDGGGQVRATSGGGPFNTARALRRLAVPSRFIGRLSTDAFGQRLRTQLEADGVEVAAPPTEAPTTLAVAAVDAAGVASYRFYAEGTSAFGSVAVDANGLAALHVGSLGLVYEPMASALSEAVRKLHRDVAIVVDPNLRPTAIADVATYRRRLAGVISSADLVKVSEEDVAWLVPDRDPVEAAADLLTAGPRAVLLTRGPGGIFVLTGSARRVVPAVEGRVVDTVGAGDAFTAGVLSHWYEGGADRAALGDLDMLSDASAFGAAVATVACGRVGADPPWRSEVPA